MSWRKDIAERHGLSAEDERELRGRTFEETNIQAAGLAHSRDLAALLNRPRRSDALIGLATGKGSAE